MMIDYKRRYDSFVHFKEDIDHRLEVWLKEHAEKTPLQLPALPAVPESNKPEINRLAIGVTLAALPGLTQRLMSAAQYRSNIVLVLPSENGEWLVFAKGEIQKKFWGPDAHARASAYAGEIASTLSDDNI